MFSSGILDRYLLGDNNFLLNLYNFIYFHNLSLTTLQNIHYPGIHIEPNIWILLSDRLELTTINFRCHFELLRNTLIFLILSSSIFSKLNFGSQSALIAQPVNPGLDDRFKFLLSLAFALDSFKLSCQL
jgi:hypothetical protein